MRVLLLCALSTTIIAAQVPARPAPGQTPPRDRPARTRPADSPEPEPRANGVIRGRVVADEPGANTPIAKARVVVRPAENPDFVDFMFTDSSGLFEFSSLPAGRYTVLAEKSGFASTRYGAEGLLDRPIAIEVTDGGREELEIRLPKGGAIAGHVVDDLGDPLVGARIMINGIRVEGTRQQLFPSPQIPSETDDQGAFRIGSLPAGRFLLSIVPRGQEPPASASSDVPNSLPTRRVGSDRTFYPSSATSGDATPIDLKPGEERLDVDVALTPFRPAVLTLSVASAPDPALNGATSPAEAIRLGVDPRVVRSIQPVRVAFASEDTPDGVSQDNVLERRGGVDLFGGAIGPQPIDVTMGPGSWAVIARKGVDGAITRLNLAPGETASTALEIRPASHVSGRVVFEGSTRRPEASSVYVDVIGAGQDRNVSPLLLLPGGRVATKPDGSFALTGLLGMVEFAVAAPRGWAVSRLTAGDRELLGAPIRFDGGETMNDIRIALTDQVGEIGGSVVESDARPAAGCKIAIFPADPDTAFNRYRMLQVQADRAGRFVVRGLPSGKYAVAPSRDLKSDSWTAPDSLARLRAGAITLTLAEHEKKALALQCGSQ